MRPWKIYIRLVNYQLKIAHPILWISDTAKMLHTTFCRETQDCLHPDIYFSNLHLSNTVLYLKVNAVNFRFCFGYFVFANLVKFQTSAFPHILIPKACFIWKQDSWKCYFYVSVHFTIRCNNDQKKKQIKEVFNIFVE